MHCRVVNVAELEGNHSCMGMQSRISLDKVVHVQPGIQMHCLGKAESRMAAWMTMSVSSCGTC